MSVTVDADSRPFWDGIAKNELRLQRCRSCERAVFYPRSGCPHCFGTDLEWFVSGGTGTVYSHTVVHRAFGAFAEQAPFVVALVDLDDGVRMLTRILPGSGGAPVPDVAIGARVRVAITRLGDEESQALPAFRVEEAS